MPFEPPFRRRYSLGSAALWLLVVASFSGVASAGTIYRCQGPKGTVFSEMPCGDDAEKRTIDASPAPSDAGAQPNAVAEAANGEETDAQWSARVRRTWNETCTQTVRSLIPTMAPEFGAETCRCSLDRYLTEHPIALLRDLEAKRDVQRNSMLMRPIMLSCYQQAEARRRRDGEALR